MEHNIDRIEKVGLTDLQNDCEYDIFIIVYTIQNNHLAEKGISIVKAANETEAVNSFKHDTQIGTLVDRINIKYVKKLPITIKQGLLYEYIN